MNQFRKLLSRRLVLTGLTAIAVVGLFLATMPSTDAVIIAGPGVWIYYSSPSYQTVVGARGTGCCGAPISWGAVTKYKRFEQIYCTDQICPN